MRLLYKGALRVLLVLLHDFPEFLCDHHFALCDAIPPTCIQMRNLVLSAFPRNMRLPDPFTPNLKVDLLPEISASPRLPDDAYAALKGAAIRGEVDAYLKTRAPNSLPADLRARLLLPPAQALAAGTRYNVPLLNALVLYIGCAAIAASRKEASGPLGHSAPLEVFQRLANELDAEGRYLFLNAVANQLRYPNNHTHYFSCVLLFLFAEAQSVRARRKPVESPSASPLSNAALCASFAQLHSWKISSILSISPHAASLPLPRGVAPSLNFFFPLPYRPLPCRR